jgi:hypothetical protein
MGTRRDLAALAYADQLRAAGVEAEQVMHAADDGRGYRHSAASVTGAKLSVRLAAWTAALLDAPPGQVCPHVRAPRVAYGLLAAPGWLFCERETCRAQACRQIGRGVCDACGRGRPPIRPPARGRPARARRRQALRDAALHQLGVRVGPFVVVAAVCRRCLTSTQPSTIEEEQ